MIGGEGEAGVFAEVVDGLHQALAKGGFAHDQGAIVILQRAGNDFGGGSGVTIDQHDDGEGLAAVAMRRGVVLIGVGAAALRNDGLALGEQVVANIDGLAQQAAGILAQIENQTLEVAEAIDGVFHLLAGGLLELREMDVADAGTNLEFQIDGGMGNFVANEVEDQRLGLAIANHRDLNVRALGAFERLGHLVRSPAVGGFAVDGKIWSPG